MLWGLHLAQSTHCHSQSEDRVDVHNVLYDDDCGKYIIGKYNLKN